MKIRIQGQPEFLLPFTMEEVELMRTVSAQHYDAVCRYASGETYRPDNANFLTSWRNSLQSQIDYPSDDPDYVPCVSATWRQLDTACKILESFNLFMLDDSTKEEAKRLRADIWTALHAANGLYGKWSAEIET